MQRYNLVHHLRRELLPYSRCNVDVETPLNVELRRERIVTRTARTLYCSAKRIWEQMKVGDAGCGVRMWKISVDFLMWTGTTFVAGTPPDLCFTFSRVRDSIYTLRSPLPNFHRARVTMSDKCWKLDLEEIHDVLITVAKEAGAMITGAKPVAEGVGSKKNCQCLNGGDRLFLTA